MANLIVSDVCNMSCAYCFARDILQSPQADSDQHFISLETFKKRLDFLARSDINEIRFIGGEPTLHPHFPELIALAQNYQKSITVFSHGVLSGRALACLEALPVGRCTVLINMNATRNTADTNEKDQNTRRIALLRLGERAILGFNIFTTNFNLDFLLPLISEAGCRKSIRLGLAHPSLSGGNVYLHPKQYPVVGRKIANFAQTAAEMGVKVEFDCGFVRCMFSDADFEMLLEARADPGWRCNPILDVDMNGRVYHCFPLADEVQAQLFDDTLAADLRATMSEQTRLHRVAGIYKECSTCPFKQNGECMGGCLANTMKRFQPASIHVSAPENILN